MAKEIYGKYRAIVTNVNDSVNGYENKGRVKVKCPKIWGESESNWCEICVPFASENSGFWFPPNVGDLVWLEFEGGDPTLPIVSGGWYKTRKTPISDYQDGDYNSKTYKDQLKRKRIKTSKGHIIEMNDIDGDERILIRSTSGHYIELRDSHNDGTCYLVMSDKNGQYVELDSNNNRIVISGDNMILNSTHGILVNTGMTIKGNVDVEGRLTSFTYEDR